MLQPYFNCNKSLKIFLTCFCNILCYVGKVTPHSIAWKVISKHNWTRILVYSSAQQCKKVQSSIEKFHWSKKLRKTENFSFNLNIRVRLENDILFVHVFLCLKVVLTIEHYITLLTILIWIFSIFWGWQLALWKLGQLAPASFFYLQQAYSHHVSYIYVLTSFDW